MKKRFVSIAAVVMLLLVPLAVMAVNWDGYFTNVLVKGYLSIGGVEYTPPNADGTAGQVLATDGSRTLSWAAAGGATAWDTRARPRTP